MSSYHQLLPIAVILLVVQLSESWFWNRSGCSRELRVEQLVGVGCLQPPVRQRGHTEQESERAAGLVLRWSGVHWRLDELTGVQQILSQRRQPQGGVLHVSRRLLGDLLRAT